MKNRRNKKRQIRELSIAILVAMLAIVLLGICVTIYKNSNTVQPAVDAEVVQKENAYVDYSYIRYNGADYAYNKDITTMLFMGIDQESDSHTIGRSDTMFLVLLDESDESITLLHISRNTMCDVEMLNEAGDTLMLSEMQITLQYTYGDGDHLSCELSSEAVSRLLYDIPVDYYLAMELDGIDSIVSDLGGISMSMNADYTYIDEAFVEGATVIMTGEQVESFVRYRDMNDTGGDEARVQRQELFLQAFLQTLNTKTNGSTTKMLSVWDGMSAYCHTDLYTDVIESLMSYEVTDEIYDVPGETVLNGTYDEYYVDEEALQALLIDLLYIEVL